MTTRDMAIYLYIISFFIAEIPTFGKGFHVSSSKHSYIYCSLAERVLKEVNCITIDLFNESTKYVINMLYIEEVVNRVKSLFTTVLELQSTILFKPLLSCTIELL